MAANGSSNNFTTATPESSMDTPMMLEIVYQSIFFMVGSFVNIRALGKIVVFLRKMKKYKHRRNVAESGRLARLSVHLIIANLLVLWVHCSSKTIWLITFYWYGGDFLCRLIVFGSTFAFHLWSNMVATIALDMFVCICFPLKSRLYGSRLIRRFITGAYVIAAICAFPQVFMKGTVQIPGTNFYQCYFLYYQSPTIILAYGIYHAVTVFYIPLALIIICYISVACIPTNSYMGPTWNSESRKSIFTPTMSVETQTKDTVRRKSSAPTVSKYRLLKTSVLIIGTYILTWLPYQVLVVIQLTCEKNEPCADMLKNFDWLVVVLLASTCINPFLYKFKVPTVKIQNTLSKAATVHRNLMKSIRDGSSNSNEGAINLNGLDSPREYFPIPSSQRISKAHKTLQDDDDDFCTEITKILPGEG